MEHRKLFISSEPAIANIEGTVILFDEYISAYGQTDTLDAERDAIFIFNDSSRDYFALAYWRVWPPSTSGATRMTINPPTRVSTVTLLRNGFLDEIQQGSPVSIRENGLRITT